MPHLSDDEKKQILDYYAQGLESDRLKKGIGHLEGARTREIISRYLDDSVQVIMDIGGGTGVYAAWLAEKGYDVRLYDLSPENIEIARKSSAAISQCQVADARKIPAEDNSADLVLLLGPLYHLIEQKDRVQALSEARRVLKPGGACIAAVINRFANLMWGVTTFGRDNRYLEDKVFFDMMLAEAQTGQHIRPPEYPWFLARAYLHHPVELQDEMLIAGFDSLDILAVEGPGWMMPDFEEAWQDKNTQEILMKLLRNIEKDPSLMGAGPHIIGVGRKTKEVKT
jgi:ubiquinone/menaquinone biosynthesis C-methylase UbiE